MTQPPSPAGVMRAGDGQADGRVVLGRQHLLREDLAGFGQPAGIERLKAFIDQLRDLAAARGPVIANGFSGEERLAGLPGRPGGAVRQEAISFLRK